MGDEFEKPHKIQTNRRTEHYNKNTFENYKEKKNPVESCKPPKLQIKRSKEIKLKSQWIIDNLGKNYVIPKIKELGEMSQEDQPVNVTDDAPEKSEKKNKFLSKYDNKELSPINKNLNE